MAEDVSNRTVVILVVLTIIISTLGTLTVSSSVTNFNDAQVPVADGTPDQTGRIGLSIASPDGTDSAPKVNSVTGNVALTIK